MPHCIFHFPGSLEGEANRASRIRPYKMLEAFRGLGLEPFVVAGSAKERIESIREISEQLTKGLQVAFTYSESVNRTIPLSEPHHLPLHPFADFSFFRLLKKMQIPFGVFYRDVFWRFAFSRSRLPWHQRMLARPFYWWEWLEYKKSISHLFLPTKEIVPFLPSQLSTVQIEELPPGCDLHELLNGKASSKILRCLYVGSIEPPLKDLSEAIEAVESLPNVQLTLCCREAEWKQFKQFYRGDSLQHVEVVHEQGQALANLYSESDVSLMYSPVIDYAEVNFPMKVAEAIGWGTPLIVCSGTVVSRFVEENNFGWAVRTKDELVGLLKKLLDSPFELEACRTRIQAHRHEHSWEKRAEKVVNVLAGLSIDSLLGGQA